MIQEAQNLRNRIASLKSELESAEGNLANLILNCRHEFGQVVSDPIVTSGYTVPGDAPGTMGIDYRSSFYVPEQRTARWTRTCRFCGKREETRETTKTVSETPIFR